MILVVNEFDPKSCVFCNNFHPSLTFRGNGSAYMEAALYGGQI
jgi:hypothetical protein